jgi:hypothetical protein
LEGTKPAYEEGAEQMEMTELTLEQVKQAERFAWHDEGIVFAYGEMYSLDITLAITSMVDRGPRVQPDIRVGGARHFQHRAFDSMFGGWHHLPDCDCQFCQPTQPDDQNIS